MTGTAELPVTLRKELAVAVARPGTPAMFLDADNRGAGHASVEEAATSGRPFFVRVREDVLAIDNDDPARADVVNALATELRGAGAGPVLVASGRPGHLHLFARIDDRRAHERYATAARRHHLDVRQAIRPPGAPHRLGLPVTFVEPVDPWSALEQLSPPLPPPMSARMLDLLRNGDVDRAYGGDRSRAIAAFTLAAFNAGWSRAQYVDALLDRGNKLGEKVWDRPLHARRNYLEGGWARAERYAEDHPAVSSRAEVLGILADVRRAVLGHPWKGMGGSSDWAVLLAHLDVAEWAAALTYYAAVRTVGEIAGLPRPTVVASHRRLCAARWIELKQPAAGGKANTWKLRTGTTLTIPTSQAVDDGGTPLTIPYLQGGVMRRNGPGSTAAPMHDVWRWRGTSGARGLGKATHRVWSVLGPEPLAPKELAAALNLKPRMLRRHLTRLEAHGLARRAGAGWVRGEADLDDVARVLGVAGTGESQQRQHAVERVTYALREHRTR